MRRPSEPAQGMSDLQSLLTRRKVSAPNLAPTEEKPAPEFQTFALRKTSGPRPSQTSISEEQSPTQSSPYGVQLRKVSITSQGSISPKRNGSRSNTPVQDEELRAKLEQRRDRFTKKRSGEHSDDDEDEDEGEEKDVEDGFQN